jgi:hypothetical protein
MPLHLALLVLGLAGLALLVGGWLVLQRIGARPAVARRLAGAHGMDLGDLLDLRQSPPRPVRVSGRIRCPDPLVAEDGEQLVAFHRDVAVHLPGRGWQTIERSRHTRSFELWDHAGSLQLDPADAAEPLITIPRVWEGSPGELVEPHSTAIARLAAEGPAPDRARAETRVISVVDRLLVLADVRIGADGEPRLAAPAGGYLVATLELPDAMRLLGGPRRGLLGAALAAAALGACLAAAGLGGALLAWALGA